jgi:hypothetical protein
MRPPFTVMILTLVLLHLWLLLLLWFCAATIWGRLADRTYEAKMRSRFRWFFMPGNLSDRTVWVRQQKVMAWTVLVLGLIVYFIVMTRIG